MGASGSLVYAIGQVRGLADELASLQSQIDGITGASIPDQTGNSGKYLSTNGTITSWETVSASVAWGGITGTLSAQTDLQSALDGKLATGLAVLLAGSYSDPSWLTSINGSIVSGNISGSAAGLTATLAIASGGTGQTSANAALNAILPSQTTHSGKALVTDGTNTSWIAMGGGGTVTSVALSAPSQFAVTGSPVTASGTLAVAWNDQAINVVLAGPSSGGAGAPTFRSLVEADIPTLAGSKISGNISGSAAGLTATLAATSGGTAQSTWALGDTIYSSAADTLAKLAGNTTTTKKFLRQTGNGTISAAPAWDTVTKSDVGLSAVENTALSTWAGSTSIVTIGTLETLTISTGTPSMTITPNAIAANETLAITSSASSSSAPVVTLKGQSGLTAEFIKCVDSADAEKATIDADGKFTGAGATLTSQSTSTEVLRVINKASQTASPIQQFDSDNSTLLSEVDEAGVASYPAVKLGAYAGTAAAGMIRYSGGALQLYTSSWADVGGSSGSTEVIPRPNTRRTTMLAADGSGSATFNGYGDAITETYTSRGSSAPGTTTPATKYQTSVATTGNNAGMNGQVGIYRTGRNIRFQTMVGVDQTTNERVWIGLTDQSQTTIAASDDPAGDYAAFRYSSGTESTWKCITKNGTTQEITDSGVAADTAMHKFEIVFDDTAGNVKFYIDGVLEATHTTYLPSASKNLRFVNIVQTLANEAKTIRTGWLYVESDL